MAALKCGGPLECQTAYPVVQLQNSYSMSYREVKSKVRFYENRYRYTPRVTADAAINSVTLTVRFP